MQRLLAVVIMFVSLSAIGQQSPWPDAFSRRNYQLGISISQFRSLPYPDQKEWPNAYPVCTDEAKSKRFPFIADLLVPNELNYGGVIMCSFFYGQGTDVRGAGLMLGRISSITAFFFISEDGKQEPRLFLITSGGPSEEFEDLVATYSAALGNPVRTEKKPFQTRNGSTFQNDIATWENDSSFVQLARFSDSTLKLQVTHALKPLSKKFKERVAETQKMKAKDL